MSKRYTVTSTQTPHGPIYQIYDRVTGATVESAYKCLKWAEREAERMESDAENQSNHNGTKQEAVTHDATASKTNPHL